MNRPMRIAFFSDGIDTPASRFRCEQFIPYFEREGIECSTYYAYNSSYNSIHAHKIAPLYKLIFRARRALTTISARGYDLLFLQRTSFPFSDFPERIRQHLGTPTVFDFDDVLHMGGNGRRSKMRTRTFKSSIEGATHIIAGNSFLADLAGRRDNLTIIPTVADSNHYLPDRRRRRQHVTTIGWMGTSGNFVSLRTILPDVLTVLSMRPDVRFRVVSNASLPELEGRAQVEQIPWERKTELELLQSFDIGLMPLADTEATRGKCGFKMIQYMATGSAVVSTDLGANRTIFNGSEAGALVPVGGDWVGPLMALCADGEARDLAGQQGRRHAERNYSIEAVLPRYLDVFRAALERDHNPAVETPRTS